MTEADQQGKTPNPNSHENPQMQQSSRSQGQMGEMMVMGVNYDEPRPRNGHHRRVITPPVAKPLDPEVADFIIRATRGSTGRISR